LAATSGGGFDIMKLAASSLLVLLFIATAFAQTPNVTGTWDATLTSPQGTFEVQMNLKQDGEKVTGHVKGPNAELPIEGTQTGADFKAKYTVNFQGTDLLITLTAVLDGTGMKGSADYGGFAKGDFTAKRSAQPAAPAAKPADNATPPAGNVSGAWAFKVESPAGSGTPTFTFKQEGEKLTGQYKGTFGEAPLTGTVKDNKIDFDLKVQAQGQEITIKYTGTLEKDGTMKGTADIVGVGSATWTAKRQ